MNETICQRMADHFYSTGDVEGLLALEIYMTDQGHNLKNIKYYLAMKLGAKRCKYSE